MTKRSKRDREREPYRNADPSERGIFILWNDVRDDEERAAEDEPVTRERERDRPSETS